MPRARRRLPVALTVLSVVAVAACGSPSSAGTASPAVTATPAAGPQRLVWVAAGPNGATVAVGTAQAGFHQIASLSASTHPVVLGAGGHRLLFWEGSTGHLFDLDIDGGAVTDRGGVPGDVYYGAAFAPDGSRVDYVRQGGPDHTWTLRQLDLVTGATTDITSSSDNLVDVPVVWSAAGIAAERQPHPNVDSPGQGLALLDPATGQRTATTTARTLSAAVAAGGTHGVISTFSPLGETHGSSAGNPNTLATVTIGGPPAVALQERDHDVRPLAIDAGGTAVLFGDWSATAPAGSGPSAGFGLFTLSAGQRHQVAAGDGSRYLAGTFLRTGGFAVVLADAGRSTLMVSSGGRSLVEADSAPGDTGQVFVLP